MNQIAILGLGKMGMQISRRLHKNGFNVLAWNRSSEPREEFIKFGGRAFKSLEKLASDMNQSPRVFWVMLPHDTLDDFLFNKDALGGILKNGDIVIDGGNSFYKDTIRRAENLNRQGIIFFDCGTSGGVWGEENGFALMVGGPKEYWPTVEPIFKVLSSENDGDANYGLVGKNGAGHFVKMVHNGIEYGMMEAIGEGFAVLQASPLNLDLLQISKIYQRGTVIRSWLIDLTRNIFEQEDISGTSGKIAATGEGEWTVNVAKEMGVDVRVIEGAFRVRQESTEEKNQNKFSNKIVALLRKQFGGHAVTKK